MNKTASQIAAVMLNRMLSESEKRLLGLESLMKDTIKEGHLLQELEHLLISRLKSRRGLDKGLEAELREHRRRMSTILKESDALMKNPREDHSIEAGGWLLEIDREASSVKTAQSL